MNSRRPDIAKTDGIHRSLPENRQTPNNVELHIEEIVLHGFAHRDRHAISEAIQSELARLFAEQGVPTMMESGHEIAKLDAGAFTVQQGTRPDAIGTQVAHSIYIGCRGHNSLRPGRQ